MNNEKLLKQARTHAKNTLEHHLPQELHYHGLKHTEEVVAAALEIGSACNLNKQELEIVEIAAWFHDLGYCRAKQNHEALSVELVDNFLADSDMPNESKQQIFDCIMATKMPQKPQNLLQQIVCDADMIHLGKPDFLEKNNRLYEEQIGAAGKNMTKEEWLQNTVDFINNHTYFTDYAVGAYADEKEKNLTRIEKQLMKEDKDKGDSKKKKKKKKNKRPKRGIETMFRLTSKNHIELSALADNKANIMISINAIMLSILVSLLVRKLEAYPHLTIPTLILITVCLVTIVFSILVTRPNVTQGRVSDEDLQNKNVNLLFFGNFHKMEHSEYMGAMQEIMKDRDYLYSNLIKDIYYLGLVLEKKYRMLRISYTIFMFGFVISIVSFVVAGLFFRAPYPY